MRPVLGLLFASLLASGPTPDGPLLALNGKPPPGATVTHGTSVGQEAPDFALPVISGGEGEGSLSDYRGQVVVISFWASWCGPCRQELPALQELFAKYKDEGLTVLAVSVDAGQREADAFVAQASLDYPVMFDANGRSVADRWNVQSLPTSYVLDREGRIAARHMGFHPSQLPALEAELTGLLRQ